MAVALLGKFTARCRTALSSTTRVEYAPMSVHSIAGSVSSFLTIPAVLGLASKKNIPTPSFLSDSYTRLLFPPKTMIPPQPLPQPPNPTHRYPLHRFDSEKINYPNHLMIMILQNWHREKQTEIQTLKCMLDSMKLITRIHPLSKNRNSTTTTVTLLPPGNLPLYLPHLQQQQQQTHPTTFTIMNRNARKAKRANHGKRPCSRVRRRYKVKAWANTSRKG